MLIHQAFSSGKSPGGTRHVEFGQRLAKYGDQLIVVTSQLDYLTGLAASPSLSRFPRLSQSESIDGVEVRRAYTPRILHRSFFHRAVALVVFAIASILVSFSVRRIDVVVGTSPSIFQAWAAWLVARTRRLPFVLEVRDLWPEFAIAMGVLTNPKLIWLSRKLEHFLITRADHIIVNSPAFSDYLANKGVPADKITLVANGVDVGMFPGQGDGSVFRHRFDCANQTVVLYAGALGPANNLDLLLDAAAEFSDEPDVLVCIVGDGKDRSRLETRCARERITNVRFAGAVPKSEMPRVLAAADICVAILQDIPMFRTTYPNKVFDYMAAGRPTVLAIGGVIADVIENGRAGIVVDPGSSSALAEAILSLAFDEERRSTMGANARHYVEQHFNRDVQAEQFRNVLKRQVKRLA